MGFLDRLRRGGRGTGSTGERWSESKVEPRRVDSSVDLARLAGGADRIAVVDCETTGIYSSDRVVEIAIVTLDLDGRVTHLWDTLVQPQRGVGASHIHGITANTLKDAPTFSDVARDVAIRLNGACVAAHNLSFDARMVGGEFSRIGDCSCGNRHAGGDATATAALLN